MTVTRSDRVPVNSVPVEPIGSRVATHDGLVQVEVTLTGSSPLMMNAMSIDTLLAIRDKKKKAKTAAKGLPREEAESKLHRLPDGRPHIPPHILTATLINAGQFVRLDGKRQISTDKKTILPGMLAVLHAEIPLLTPGTNESATWEVDICLGRNPNGGEGVCLVRPRFDAWEIRCIVEVDQGQMPLSMARELIDIAGRRVGLLEHRPQKRGTFGCFKVTRWAEVSTT